MNMSSSNPALCMYPITASIMEAKKNPTTVRLFLPKILTNITPVIALRKFTTFIK